MSLYDKAKVLFSAAAGAGGEGVAYNIKPVEKLKVDEYITNGGFDDGTTGWGASPSITVSSGKAVFDGSGYMALYQNDIFEEGKVYKISLTATIRKGQGIRIGTGEDSQDITGSNTPITTSGSHSFYYTGQGGTNDHRIVIRAHNDGTSYDFDIDNVSVREVEQKANDFSFVRASDLTATYEGPDGLIKKTRENLIKYSNTLDGTGWSNTTGSLIDYNAAVGGKSGYDGSTNAWLIDKTTTVNSYVGGPYFGYDGVFTWSMYAKNEGTTDNGLHMYTPYANAYFNLVNGQIISQGGSNKVEVKMVPVTGSSGDTDRWYRCSVTGVGEIVDNDAGDRPRFKVVDTAGNQSTGKIFVQNFQFEAGLVATPYIDTTDTYSKKTAGVVENEPRYDYSGGDAALLLEPVRTNFIPHSEYGGGYEVVDSNLTVTDNAEVSPEGLNNAVKIEDISTSSATQAVKFGGLESGSVVSRTFTASLYIKPVNSGDVGGNVYLSIQRRNGDFEGSTETIEIDSADWKRYEMTYTFTGEGSGNQAGCDFKMLRTGTIDDIYVYGVQLEEGSYATSYIPTYGSSATRDNDNATIEDINAGTSYTVLFDFDATSNELLNTILYYFFDDNDKVNQSDAIFTPRWYKTNSNENDSFRIYDQRGLAYPITSAYTSTTKKWVMRVDGTSFDLFRDNAGTPQKITGADLSGTRSLQKISIRPNTQLIKQLIIFDSALTDAECLSLTT